MTNVDYWNAAAATLETAQAATSDHWAPAEIDLYVGAIERALGEQLRGEHPYAFDYGCGVGRLTLPVASRFPTAMVCGFDVSVGMLTHAVMRAEDAGSINTAFGLIEKMDEGWASAAWSILVLQHLDADDTAAAIRRIGAALVVGGRALLQYVEGDLDVPLTRDHHLYEMIGWCSDAGLRVIDSQEGFLYPEWTWLTCEKVE